MPDASIQQIDGVTVEFILAPKVVVFSHGFGVRRDASGFFTELVANLPEGYGYVLFDYYQYPQDNITVISSFSEQVKILRTVLDWTRSQVGVDSVSIIAHSMGCIVTSLAQPSDIQKSIFLAPPTSIGENTRKYFTERPGAYQKDGFWYVPRRNGTVSKIPVVLFDEFETIDAARAINKYANKTSLLIIAAGADEVIKDFDTHSLTGVDESSLTIIDGANHNFEQPARPELIKIVRQFITGV